MARLYKLRADYPLAGSDDGVPVKITFEYVPRQPDRLYRRNGDPGEPGHPAALWLHEVEAVGMEVPIPILQAIRCWAGDHLGSDEGREAAFAVVDAMEDAQ